MPPEPATETPSTAEPTEKKREPGLLERWLAPESRSRRWIFGLLIYAVCLSVFAAVAGTSRLATHTPFNHYAHFADAWLNGRNDLRNGAPGYAGGNDFAVFEGKTYISFPPFPAVLMLPFVKLAGSPENFRDGQFIVWLAGIGPAVLFLVLEKLRRTGRSPRSERQNAVLALLFAFGSVYFFTAVQGTVWFAAHVVGVGVGALFVLTALDAERPLLAGLLAACAWTTRPAMLFLTVLFAFEAFRVCCKGGLPDEGEIFARIKTAITRLDKGAFLKRCAVFSVPILISFALCSWLNSSRYHDPSPFAFGHEHLTVVWRERMAKWGLFSLHFLPKNLGVVLTILPWLPPKNAAATAPLMQINEHGLALWFTTPLFFWLLRPKKSGYLYASLTIVASLIALLDLLYQNSGWRQFGYRFSNDYAVLLFVMVAIGARPMRVLFGLAAAWSVAWNVFGAVSFDRSEFDKYYFRDGSQRILYQDD